MSEGNDDLIQEALDLFHGIAETQDEIAKLKKLKQLAVLQDEFTKIVKSEKDI